MNNTMNSLMDKEFRKKFLTSTDDTGRFIHVSSRTGKMYGVEPIGDPHLEWGSINQSTGDLNVKKGWKKYRGSIDKEESLITVENGFKNIETLGAGMSPHQYIDWLDSKYPDKK